MKKRIKYDRWEESLTQDRKGFTAFRYTFFLGEKVADVIILSDCSHRRAWEKIQDILLKKMEYVAPEKEK